MAGRPPLADDTQIWRSGTGQDPARRLIPDSQLFHKRPSISSGANVFVWPGGVEGFRSSGQALLGKHYFIGDDDVDVQVIHLDEARFEMSGVFAGKTSVDNMRELKALLASPSPDRGKILYVPGIFERIQYVNCENYDFQHDPDDRTHSISYQIIFIKTGIGKLIKDPHGKPPIPNPKVKKKNKGKSHRKVTVQQGRQTLRQIAKFAYGNANLWTRVLELNETRVKKLAPNVPRHALPNHRFPLGTKFDV